jgi:hypothetical protein
VCYCTNANDLKQLFNFVEDPLPWRLCARPYGHFELSLSVPWQIKLKPVIVKTSTKSLDGSQRGTNQNLPSQGHSSPLPQQRESYWTRVTEFHASIHFSQVNWHDTCPGLCYVLVDTDGLYQTGLWGGCREKQAAGARNTSISLHPQ